MRYLIFIVLAFASQSVWALGQLGHQLVCQLAFDNLSKQHQQQINQLLQQLPVDEQRMLNRYVRADESSPITFAKSCTWADAIKKQPQYQQFKTWHFVNVARDIEHITDNVCQRDCVTAAIPYHLNQVKTLADGRQKLEALMFLGHWLGDIHQPLHVSFADDWGGNKITVPSIDGRCTNMHWLWDECLLTRSNLSYEQLLSALHQQWQRSPIQQWQQSRVSQWADESLQLVRSPELGYCTLHDQLCDMPNPVQLVSNYQDKFFPVLMQRMVQASARLSFLLDHNL
jgi:hypothetical protein